MVRSCKSYITTAPALPPGLCFSSQKGSQYLPSKRNLWHFKFLPSSNCRGTHSSRSREESWTSFPRVLLAEFAPPEASRGTPTRSHSSQPIHRSHCVHRVEAFPHGRNQPRAFFVVSQECQSLTRAPLSMPHALKLTDHKVLTEQTDCIWATG